MTHTRTGARHHADFELVGKVVSVQVQRRIEARLLGPTTPKFSRVLSVGCGGGGELAALLADVSPPAVVTAVDIAPVFPALRESVTGRRLGDRLSCYQMDLLGLAGVPGYAEFDVAQCGFVLHDIPFPLKGRAVQLLAGAVRPGGVVLVSDFFLDERQSHSGTLQLYQTLLGECNTAFRSGRLTTSEYGALLGDGETPGFLRSRDEALRGIEAYDTRPDFVARVERTGLVVEAVERNPRCRWAWVLLLRRPRTACRSPRQNEAARVFD